jgi:hypothetical protein
MGDSTFGSGFCVTAWVSLMLDIFYSSGGAYMICSQAFTALLGLAIV